MILRSPVSTIRRGHALRRALVASLAAASSLGAQELQREADPIERHRLIEMMRAYPFESLDMNPVATVRALGAASGGRIGTAANGLSAWRAIGPFGFTTSGFYGSAPNGEGGRVRTVAIHPTNPSIVYAGAASGGVWRSTDGGATWTPLTDQACTLNSGSIAIDPVDPTIVYVGTGEPAGSQGCGLLRSFDSGNSWTEINGNGVLAPTNGRLANTAYKLRVDRASAGSRTNAVVLYAASNGLHRSANSGTTWNTVLTGFVSDVVQDPTRPQVWWAARGSGATAGLYRSGDNGASWTLVGAANTGTARVALAVSPVAPNTVWMMEANGARFGALRRYDEATNTWTTRAARNLYSTTTRLDFGGQSTYNFVLQVDPTDTSTVYVGGSRLYRSRNGGDDFSLFAYELHVDWHALEFAPSDPNIMLAGNDGGVYVSYDRGNSWTTRNTNIVVSQFYQGLAVHPTIPNVIAGGLQDNSSLWGFGSFWTLSSPSGDGGFNAWSQDDPSVFFSMGYLTGSSRNTYLFRHQWQPVSASVTRVYRGFDINERGAFIPPMVMDPTNSARLYFGTTRVYATSNEGTVWTPLTGDLTKGSGFITAIAVSRADPRVVWAGTSDGNVQLSQDAGVSFRLVNTGLPARAISDIAVHPTDPARAVITFSGSGIPHVWQTTDAGSTWTDISGALPDISFNAAVFIPGTTRLFVAGDVGVWELTNESARQWSNVGQGVLPNVRITDLVYQAATGILYVGTYGRGLWATTLLTGTAVLRGDTDRDGSITAFDAALVQQALVGIRPAVGTNPMPAGDANCNGTLDAGDVIAILQFVAGSAPASLCVGKVQ